MIGPSISLYALAIIMQPTFQQERPDISHFQMMQRSGKRKLFLHFTFDRQVLIFTIS